MLISAAGALNANLFAYLFGSILTVTRSDLVVIATLGLGSLVVIAVFLRGLIAVSLDEEGARVAGLPVAALNGLVSMLAALTIGVSMRIVGHPADRGADGAPGDRRTARRLECPLDHGPLDPLRPRVGAGRA